MGKRGQMYSVIAIMIAIPMIMFFSYSMMSSQASRENVYEGIVAEQISVVANSMDADFSKAMEISGKRALIAAVNWQVINGKNLSDAVSNMTNLIETGMINGTQNLIMENNTLVNWSNKISEVRTNFDTNIEYGNISIVADGFNLIISSEINVSISDNITQMKKMRVNRPKEVSILIEDIDDPLYPLNTNGALHRTIKPFPYEYKAKKVVTGGPNSTGSCSGNFTTNSSQLFPYSFILVVADSKTVSDSVLNDFLGVVSQDSRNLTEIGIDCFVTGNDTAYSLISELNDTGYKKIFIDNVTKSVWSLPLLDAVEKGYYFEGDGPNITNRMENLTNTSVNGIESIVDIQSLFLEDMPIRENQVSVDYLYFSKENYIGYSVRGFPGWFRLNCEKASEYGVTELLDSTC